VTGPGPRISTVVFDLGGVLIDWDPRHLYRQLFRDPAQMEEFLARVCTQDWHHAHDLGEDTRQSCQRLAKRHPEQREMIMAWADRGEDMVRGQLDQAVAVLAELRAAGMRCLALSNMEAETFPVRRARFGFMNLFDGFVISGVEGVAKPDPEIFAILLRRYRLTPTATLFIDDAPPNVAAARALGLPALRYTCADDLRRDLRSLGLPVSAPAGQPA
jgi:HAD superfamily hydrolase (TIGR01509 family)